MFLELWKRNQARLVSAWGLTETALDMETRPEFDALVTTTRVNPITGKEEPVLPTWNKVLRFVGALSGVAFMVSLSSTLY
jgi:anoctamin-4